MNVIGTNDKVPPYSIEVEDAVIGSLLSDPDCVDEVISILSTEMFYTPCHQKMFSAINSLHRKNKSTDPITVTNYLRDSGEIDECGGVVGLTKLSGIITASYRATQYAMIVKQKYIQREMIRLGNELIMKGFDNFMDVSDLMEYAERELFKIGDVSFNKDDDKKGFLFNLFADLLSKREKGNELIGLPSGITSLDRITMGWQKGDLVIVAARPSMGKSALALQFANYAAQSGHSTLLFSLEMTSIQLAERMMVAETEMDSYDLKRGRNIDWLKIENILRNSEDTPLWVNDSAHMTIYEFRSRVRRAKKKHKVELVICDYLNLFTGDVDKDNMSEKYGSISKMFKAVAKECEVAIIALAQLNRNPEGRAIQFPKLADLRNSGEIEQDADIVIFPVRYKMIGMSSDEGRDLTNYARIDVAKNRNGRTGVVEIEVSEDCSRWGIETTPDIIAFSEPKHDPTPY